MKTLKNVMLIISFIYVLFMSLPGYSQTILLNKNKNTVIREMNKVSNFKLSVEAKDYVEYQGANIAIGYRFENNTCNEIVISMESNYRKYFLNEKENCNCWLETKTGWVYKEFVNKQWVLIREVSDSGVTSFIYYLK